MREHSGRARAPRPGPAAFVGLVVAAGLLAACAGPARTSGAGPNRTSGAGPNRTPGAAATPATAAEAPGAAGGAGGPAYPALVRDASWTSRDGERALVLTPTTYLREHNQVRVAEEAWRRVVAAVPEADTPGMRDQFVCHAQFAATKDAWYLEPARPAVGYARTVAAGCNPGSPRDVG